MRLERGLGLRGDGIGVDVAVGVAVVVLGGCPVLLGRVLLGHELLLLLGGHRLGVDNTTNLRKGGRTCTRGLGGGATSPAHTSPFE